MTDRSRTTVEDGSRTTDDGRAADATDASADGFRRREFVALGAGASATLLAGCAGDASLPSSDGSDGSGGSDGSDGSQTLTGNFRLLISDAPADIGDFDRLDVTLDRARVFEARDGDDEDDDEDAEDDEEEADGDDEADETDQNATETDEDDESLNGTADEDDDANETDVDDGGDDEEAVEAEDDDEDGDDDEDEEDEDDDEEGRGFTVVELGGATVDLTQVIDEDAIAVFDGEIPAGTYEKIELEVSAVEGIVDGEAVDVKLPSEKLQITNGFEVAPDEELSFVFDINVVKRGKNNGYILKPVISGSGVAGRDVEVNEIDDDDDDDSEGDDSEDDDDSDESEDGDSEDGDSEDDDSEDDDATGGNETDDAENGTADGS